MVHWPWTCNLASQNAFGKDKRQDGLSAELGSQNPWPAGQDSAEQSPISTNIPSSLYHYLGFWLNLEARTHGRLARIWLCGHPFPPIFPHLCSTALFLDLQHDVTTEHSLGAQKHTKWGNIYDSNFQNCKKWISLGHFLFITLEKGNNRMAHLNLAPSFYFS
jgi:hypothetical protein